MDSAPYIVLVDAPPARPDGAAGDPGAIAEALRRECAMSNKVWLDIFGHCDFDLAPTNLLNELRDQKYFRKRRLVALDREVPGLGTSAEGLPLVLPETRLGGAEVIAATGVHGGQRENAHLIEQVEVAVRSDWRRRGVGSALLGSLEQVARAWGCTTIHGYSTHVGTPPADQELIMPAEGPFGVPSNDPVTRFALAHGFSLAQGERHSMQTLPEDPTALGIPTPPADYELLIWNGHIDPALAEGLASLYTSFEKTIPYGDLDWVPETFTAERILDRDRQRHLDHDSVAAAARQQSTGELVAVTELLRTHHQREPVWQAITIVAPEHRGHGLGRTIKLAAVHEARRHWPEAKRVHTWNAGENDHMWAINESLGYVTVGVAGAWQKKLA